MEKKKRIVSRKKLMFMDDNTEKKFFQSQNFWGDDRLTPYEVF